MTMTPDQRALLAVSAAGYDTAACHYLLDSVAEAIKAAESEAVAMERRRVEGIVASATQAVGDRFREAHP